MLDREPFLPPAVVELCGWVADYYMSGIGDAIGVAMPPTSRRASGYKTHRIVAVTPHGLSALASNDGQNQDETLDLTARQRDVLQTLAGAPTGLPASVLRDRGASADVVRRLATRGLVAIRAEYDERDPFAQAAFRKRFSIRP